MSVSEQEAVQKLAAAMRELPEDRHINPAPIHLFAPGIYVRVLHMPAGSVIVSKIHKTEHFCLALSGRALVRVGDEVEEVIGPKLMRTLPGTQRALSILEDATWITFHPTEETDLDSIEQQLIAQSFDDPELVEHLASACLTEGAACPG